MQKHSILDMFLLRKKALNVSVSVNESLRLNSIEFGRHFIGKTTPNAGERIEICQVFAMKASCSAGAAELGSRARVSFPHEKKRVTLT